MKKAILMLMALPLMLLAASCSNSDEPDGVEKVYTLDNPYEFPDEYYEFTAVDPSKYENVMDMFTDLQVPDKTLDKMTSRAIILTGVNHPYAFCYMAYNYPILWINNMMDYFNGFVELQKRKDCETAALEVYNKYKAAYDAQCVRVPDQNEWQSDEIKLKWQYEFVSYVAKYFKVIPIGDSPFDGSEEMYRWQGVNQ